jgi:two-component system response regulator DesR
MPRELGLAYGTVRNHASGAIIKLHTDTRQSAARIAHDHGWI